MRGTAEMYYEESDFLETADGGTLDLIARARKLTREYYLSDYEDTEKREAILRKLLGGMGENVAVDTPFHCDYVECTDLYRLSPGSAEGAFGVGLERKRDDIFQDICPSGGDKE